MLLQVSLASQSTAVFTAEAVCHRRDISFSVSCRWSLLVRYTTLQVSFLSTSVAVYDCC